MRNPRPKRSEKIGPFASRYDAKKNRQQAEIKQLVGEDPEESTFQAAASAAYKHTTPHAPAPEDYEAFVEQCLQHAVLTNPLEIGGPWFDDFNRLLGQTLHRPEIADAFANKTTFATEFPQVLKTYMLDVARKESPVKRDGTPVYDFMLTNGNGTKHVPPSKLDPHAEDNKQLRHMFASKLEPYAEECVKLLPPSHKKSWASTVTPKADAALTPTSPIRAFQLGCYREAEEKNLVGYYGYVQVHLMQLISSALTADNSFALLASDDVTAKAFAKTISTNLEEQAKKVDNIPSMSRANKYVLEKGEDGSLALKHEVRRKVTKLARDYFNEHWPDVQAQLAQQQGRTK